MLSRLAPFQKEAVGSRKKHKEPSRACELGVIYHIALDFDFGYIDQTACRVSGRLLEHKIM